MEQHKIDRISELSRLSRGGRSPPRRPQSGRRCGANTALSVRQSLRPIWTTPISSMGKGETKLRRKGGVSAVRVTVLMENTAPEGSSVSTASPS